MVVSLFWEFIVSLSAAGGALSTGIVLGWTSLSAEKIINGAYGFQITAHQFMWISSALHIGAATACIPVGHYMNLLGRRLTMLLLVCPFTVGWLLLIWPRNFFMLCIGRFILGACCGGLCVTAPIYIAEMSSDRIRGTLCSFFQLFITIGILVAYLLCWKVQIMIANTIAACFPLFFGATLYFMPETPAYLVSNNKFRLATKSIRWLHGRDCDPAMEIAVLQADELYSKSRKNTRENKLAHAVTRNALIISLGLMFFQQMSGVNAVIFYTGDIFREAKTGINNDVATVFVGVLQVPATMISTLCVDRIGRRCLLMISGSIMCFCTTMIGNYFYKQAEDVRAIEKVGTLPVIGVSLFIIAFSLGYGPVPWIAVGELFSHNINSIAAPICCTMNWVMAFIITKSFDYVKGLVGIGQTFWIFSAFSAIGIYFVYNFVIETNGKSLLEIQDILIEQKYFKKEHPNRRKIPHKDKDNAL